MTTAERPITFKDKGDQKMSHAEAETAESVRLVLHVPCGDEIPIFPDAFLMWDITDLVVATTVLDLPGANQGERRERVERIKRLLAAAFNLPAEGWTWETERDVSLRATGIGGAYRLLTERSV